MLSKLESFFTHLPPFAWNLTLTGIAVLAGLILKWIIARILRFYSNRDSNYSMVHSIFLRLGKPFNYLLPLLLFNMVLPAMRLSPEISRVLERLTGILLIISFALLLIGIVKVCEDYVNKAFDTSETNNLRDRKIRTQLQFLRKVAISVIVILAVCAILLSFENLRRIGAGLLTGVGVSGIIIGFAAQRSIANFLAGMQIAFTQPIRIDDVLIVEGEWGRVEEITLTYVVLNIWDKRKLIIPINYFIEKPFQNWTRTGSDILGVVFLYLDYTAPLDEIRKEFNRLVESNALWDGKVKVVQVTDTTEHTIQVRALVSASNSGRAFDLRCFVRENLVTFIQRNYPGSLPKTRALLDQPDSSRKEVFNQSDA